PLAEVHLAPSGRRDPAARSYATWSPERMALARGAAQLRDLGAPRGQRGGPCERLAPRAALARLREVEPEAPAGVVLPDRGSEALPRGTEFPARELDLAEE